MVASVSALEAETRIDRLLDRVSWGDEIVVARHDKPVARIVPVGRSEQREERAAVVGLRELRRAIAARREYDPVLTTARIKSLISAPWIGRCPRQ